ncbi:MAG: ATP-binding protein [Planctomycetota bacterium]|nr:ATP-binding protein [Planctomycetota bacterium]
MVTEPTEIDEFKGMCQPATQSVTIPPRYTEKEVELADPYFVAWIENIIKDGHDKSPLIIGATGVGKTTQMYAIAREICAQINAINRNLWNNINSFDVPKYIRMEIKVTTEIDLVYTVKQATSEREKYALLKEYRSAPVLMVDDFGTAKLNESALEIILNIIDHRLQYCLPTVITTNKNIDELIKDGYGERIGSKLCELCQPVTITGEDRRIKQ